MNRFPNKTEWQYSFELQKQAEKIPVGVINEQGHAIGMRQGDALIVAMDAAYQYASVYRARFGGRLKSDGALGQHWLSWIKGIRGLLDGDGGIAMARKSTQDSKDNGALDGLFFAALEIAGFTEGDL